MKLSRIAYEALARLDSGSGFDQGLRTVNRHIASGDYNIRPMVAGP